MADNVRSDQPMKRPDLSRPRTEAKKSSARGWPKSSKRSGPAQRRTEAQSYGSIDSWGDSGANPGRDPWYDKPSTSSGTNSFAKFDAKGFPNQDATGFANFRNYDAANAKPPAKSKGTSLSRRLPFGQAMAQSMRRSRKHEIKKLESRFNESIDFEMDCSVRNFNEISKFTISNDVKPGGGGADNAIIEYNNKLRNENADLSIKFDAEVAKNSGNENRIKELEAMEKVLRDENRKLRADLANSEANNIALKRRFENAKDVKLQAPWRQATCMVLDNFRAAAKITEDALVKMGADLERKAEFSKAAEVRLPVKLDFGGHQSVELDVIRNCFDVLKKSRGDAKNDAKASQ